MADLLDRLKTALAERYRIDRELGAGGMATVYLAQDLKHDRPVALKVLRPELAASLGADRFLAEIRLTARLQHPHIVPLFDSGEAGGFLYYVMPYIEGESLRARLEREQRLDVEAALAVACPVAQALAYAHEAGVVHRDIKPENILLSRGQPFVTDFGIARAVTVAGGERLTATGLAIGTPAYMSPEQALGEEALDARSDVYSLGCVIYELLVGEPPFSGATVQALIARRLTGPPPHLTGVPAAVDEVVRRSLATAPQDRFATAVALADALVEAARRPTAPELSLVVLPFENLSPDPDNAFFADGLTEEVIADLSKVKALRVSPRTASARLKDTTKDLGAIGAELGVRFALTGGVRRAGDGVRITVQLVDAVTDETVWGEKYAGELADVFDLQERIARQIVAALRVGLTAGEERRIAERRFRSPQALECYLRARVEFRKFTKPATDEAAALVHRALAAEGDNAALYALLAYCQWNYFNLGVADETALGLADAYATHALALGGTAEAHQVRGLIAIFRGDMRLSVAQLREAARLLPDADSLGWLAISLASVGRSAEAKTYAEQACALDPLNGLGWCARSMALLLSGEAVAALESVRRYAGPQGPWLGFFSAVFAAFGGARNEAIAGFRRQAAAGGEIWSALAAVWSAALDGDAPGVRTAAGGALEAEARHDFQNAWFLADCRALVGDMDAALEWLAVSIDLGFCNHAFLSRHDPFLAPLRSDPRFEALLERVREKERAFEA